MFTGSPPFGGEALAGLWRQEVARPPNGIRNKARSTLGNRAGKSTARTSGSSADGGWFLVCNASQHDQKTQKTIMSG